jgi:hypothetical protein
MHTMDLHDGFNSLHFIDIIQMVYSKQISMMIHALDYEIIPIGLKNYILYHHSTAIVWPWSWANKPNNRNAYYPMNQSYFLKHHENKSLVCSYHPWLPNSMVVLNFVHKTQWHQCVLFLSNVHPANYLHGITDHYIFFNSIPIEFLSIVYQWSSAERNWFMLWRECCYHPNLTSKLLGYFWIM